MEGLDVVDASGEIEAAIEPPPQMRPTDTNANYTFVFCDEGLVRYGRLPAMPLHLIVLHKTQRILLLCPNHKFTNKSTMPAMYCISDLIYLSWNTGTFVCFPLISY